MYRVLELAASISQISEATIHVRILGVWVKNQVRAWLRTWHHTRRCLSQHSLAFLLTHVLIFSLFNGNLGNILWDRLLLSWHLTSDLVLWAVASRWMLVCLSKASMKRRYGSCAGSLRKVGTHVWDDVLVYVLRSHGMFRPRPPWVLMKRPQVIFRLFLVESRALRSPSTNSSTKEVKWHSTCDRA